MKKVIAIVLAMVMLFSTGIVAFAEDTAEPSEEVSTTAPEEITDAEDGEGFDFLDLPFWTVPAGLKVAKILLKIAKVFYKVAAAFGIVDTGDIIGALTDLINGATTEAPEESTTAAEADTPALLVA